MKRAGVLPRINAEADADIVRYFATVDIKCLVAYLNEIYAPDCFDEMSVICRQAELIRDAVAA